MAIPIWDSPFVLLLVYLNVLRDPITYNATTRIRTYNPRHHAPSMPLVCSATAPHVLYFPHPTTPCFWTSPSNYPMFLDLHIQLPHVFGPLHPTTPCFCTSTSNYHIFLDLPIQLSHIFGPPHPTTLFLDLPIQLPCFWTSTSNYPFFFFYLTIQLPHVFGPSHPTTPCCWTIPSNYPMFLDLPIQQPHFWGAPSNYAMFLDLPIQLSHVFGPPPSNHPMCFTSSTFFIYKIHIFFISKATLMSYENY